MAPSDDLRAYRRRLWWPVLMATVFLTVIGVSTGLVLGTRAKRSAVAHQQVVASSPAPSTAGSAAPPCRPQTQAAAARLGVRGPLHVVFEVRTTVATVWICQAPDGALYYHANNGGEQAPWVEGRTALFLPGVVRAGDGYAVRATDPQNRVTSFTIGRNDLVIVKPDGSVQKQPVLAVVVG